MDVLLLDEGSSFAARPAADSRILADVTFGPMPWYRKYDPDPMLLDWLKNHVDCSRYDLVVGRYLTPISKLRGFIDAPHIVDADDAYYRYVHDRSLPSFTRSWTKTAGRFAMAYRALRQYQHVWFSSPRDIRLFGIDSATLLPNIPPKVPRQPPSDGTPLILFVGALWYAPNREGIEWFIEKCWPGIRRQVPESRMRLVGACPLEQRKRWAQVPGIECPGFVQDLAAEYREAAFTISPVRFGGGTQIKILETYAYGRAAVVSLYACAGYAGAFQPGHSIVMGTNARSFVEQCCDLLASPETAARIADAGRQVVERQFSWSLFRTRVAEAVHRTCSEATRNTRAESECA